MKMAMRWVILGLLFLSAVAIAASFKSPDPVISVLTACLVIVGALQWWLIESQDKHFTNSERAWLLADLGWYQKSLNLVNCTSSLNGPVRETTQANISLNCRNEGKSPAWIDKVSARMQMVSEVRLPSVAEGTLTHHGTMEPLGANQHGSYHLKLNCDGHRGQHDYLSVFVVVDYHDIFGIARKTTVGYCVNPAGGLRHLLEFPKLNQNT